MVTSYVCDGFADAGTALGASLLGAGKKRATAVLCTRIVAYGFVVGVACGFALIILREQLCFALTEKGGGRENGIDTNTNNNGTSAAGELARAQLREVWPLLVGMQPVNALVFVYDGLIYATHSFRYVRNLMLVGVGLVFAPLLATGFAVTAGSGSLLWIWGAKAALNLWRALGAVALIEGHFKRRAWTAVEGSGDVYDLVARDHGDNRDHGRGEVDRRKDEAEFEFPKETTPLLN